MSVEQYKFTPLRMGTPQDNLSSAIGLIQTHILAEQTTLNADVMFGNAHFRGQSLETAVALLVAMTGEIEDMRWGED